MLKTRFELENNLCGTMKPMMRTCFRVWEPLLWNSYLHARTLKTLKVGLVLNIMRQQNHWTINMSGRYGSFSQYEDRCTTSFPITRA